MVLSNSALRWPKLHSQSASNFTRELPIIIALTQDLRPARIYRVFSGRRQRFVELWLWFTQASFCLDFRNFSIYTLQCRYFSCTFRNGSVNRHKYEEFNIRCVYKYILFPFLQRTLTFTEQTNHDSYEEFSLTRDIFGYIALKVFIAGRLAIGKSILHKITRILLSIFFTYFSGLFVYGMFTRIKEKGRKYSQNLLPTKKMCK